MAKILSAGIQSLVEDLNGRAGYMDIGIAHSGFMDHYTGRLVNKVVGNELNEAGLEIAGGNFAIEFEEDSIIAYGGATIEGTLNDTPVEPYMAIAVHPGDVFALGRIAPTTKGFRQYLAIAGGMEAEEYLGSKATATYGNFGGYQGRSLKKDDVLCLGTITEKNKAHIGKKVKQEYIPEFSDTWVMRAIPGPDAAPDFITEEGMEEIFSTEYKAQMFCDRSGLRLKGPKPIWNPERANAGGHPSNITDHGYPGPGGVNISGDTLILFPAECPTSGGLICALSVIYVDQWMMGQIFPGRDKIKFSYCTQREAIALRKEQMAIFEGETCLE